MNRLTLTQLLVECAGLGLKTTGRDNVNSTVEQCFEDKLEMAQAEERTSKCEIDGEVDIARRRLFAFGYGTSNLGQ